jgi:hypothetical protein
MEKRLDRDVAAEAAVHGAIDRTHPAAADLRGDVIWTEGRSEERPRRITLSLQAAPP